MRTSLPSPHYQCVWPGCVCAQAEFESEADGGASRGKGLSGRESRPGLCPFPSVRGLCRVLLHGWCWVFETTWGGDTCFSGEGRSHPHPSTLLCCPSFCGWTGPAVKNGSTGQLRRQPPHAVQCHPGDRHMGSPTWGADVASPAIVHSFGFCTQFPMCVSGFPHSSKNSWPPAECPVSQLNSDTIYAKMASDSTG